ncbi:MAG: DUF4393 domain-containing protein [Nodosilinea sp. WJT8-NPBG4]|jgi:hypothetical protein|nr:DUF4393 domain-containing protein [Nodosilinea sp. WJT8-NPBG4]
MDINDIVGLGKTAENTLAITKELRGFLASIFGPLLGPATEEIGQYIADPIRIARQERLIKYAEKSQKQIAELDAIPQAIKPKILFPIMEYSTLEDDDYLQDKWVNLLTSAAIGNYIHPSYPRILSELSPLDAKLLEVIYKSYQEEERERQRLKELKAIAFGAGFPGHSAGMLAESLSVNLELIEISLGNLERLNLCSKLEINIEPEEIIIGDRKSYTRYLISPLGASFVAVVRRPT